MLLQQQTISSFDSFFTSLKRYLIFKKPFPKKWEKDIYLHHFFSCVAIYTRAKSVFLWFVVLSSRIQKENKVSCWKRNPRNPVHRSWTTVLFRDIFVRQNVPETNSFSDQALNWTSRLIDIIDFIRVFPCSVIGPGRAADHTKKFCR